MQMRGNNSRGQVSFKFWSFLPDFRELNLPPQAEVVQIAAHFGVSFVLMRDPELDATRLFKLGRGMGRYSWVQEGPLNWLSLKSPHKSEGSSGIYQKLSTLEPFINLNEVVLPRDNLLGRLIPGRNCLYYLLDGEVWVAGENGNSKLGFDSNEVMDRIFRKLPFKDPVVDVATGADFAIYLTS